MKDAVVITYPNKMSVLVDPCDVELALKHRWCDNGKGYAVRGVKVGVRSRRLSLMHREIVGAATGEVVDHINSNKKDNRRSNLRVCTKAQNGQNRGKNKNNTTGYKGVSFHKSAGKFSSSIATQEGYVYLGLFPTPQEAHSAYCEAGRKLHGEFFNPG